MRKLVNSVVVFIITIWVFTSCKSKEKICFNNRSGWTYNLNTLLDTSQLYVEVDITDEKNGASDLFVKESRLHIKKYKPAMKFHSNGKLAYFTETISSNYTKGAIYGHYRVYNDTIQICRKYRSAQAGNFYSSELLIVSNKGLQTVSGQIIRYYEKL